MSIFIIANKQLSGRKKVYRLFFKDLPKSISRHITALMYSYNIPSDNEIGAKLIVILLNIARCDRHLIFESSSCATHSFVVTNRKPPYVGLCISYIQHPVVDWMVSLQLVKVPCEKLVYQNRSNRPRHVPVWPTKSIYIHVQRVGSIAHTLHWAFANHCCSNCCYI